MAICAVTGGAGFIGSHLVESLVHDGWAVRVLDNLDSGHRKNLANVADKVEFIEGDVRDRTAIDKSLVGASLAVHLAAMVSVPKSIAQPTACHDICATGTMNLLTGAKDAGVKRVVFAATSAAYGDTGEGAISETNPLKPLSPYAAAKLAGEHYCSVFSEVLGVETVRLRFFNVFGPRQDPNSPYSGVISIFCSKLLKGECPTIFGDGLQTRDFVSVKDVVKAIRKAGEVPAANGKVFNVGTGKKTTLLDLLAALNRAAGTNVEPILAPARPGDIRHSLADITAIRQTLGYEPAVPFETGITECLEYYRRLASAEA